MKRTITFWRSSGHEALRGKTVELFKVSWDEDSEGWVRDDTGPYWGIYKLGTEEPRRLTRDPKEMGIIKIPLNEEETEEVDRLVTEDPTITRVDHLEAEDVTVTPEGLNLGEEE